ncbi:hypothetical protein [Mucisphaera calidilacus]|uniref:Uncharacterized protein n=1 Tax=Mucisphaera calidilacus TaxID=2527982 RepID=A0A518BYL7_9BACT|nr:hypothetical protein [Mucisphaera calidilacus]QDU72060.1 hypothetical protein Pan265_19220 [Mucisphaera calidilacus]
MDFNDDGDGYTIFQDDFDLETFIDRTSWPYSQVRILTDGDATPLGLGFIEFNNYSYEVRADINSLGQIVMLAHTDVGGNSEGQILLINEPDGTTRELFRTGTIMPNGEQLVSINQPHTYFVSEYDLHFNDNGTLLFSAATRDSDENEHWGGIYLADGINPIVTVLDP